MGRTEHIRCSANARRAVCVKEGATSNHGFSPKSTPLQLAPKRMDSSTKIVNTRRLFGRPPTLGHSRGSRPQPRGKVSGINPLAPHARFDPSDRRLLCCRVQRPAVAGCCIERSGFDCIKIWPVLIKIRAVVLHVPDTPPRTPGFSESSAREGSALQELEESQRRCYGHNGIFGHTAYREKGRCNVQWYADGER
jgi:hypothetical protein